MTTELPFGVAKGMSGHQCAQMKTDVWLTPPEILQALGTFDLDPCAPSERPWDMARTHLTIQDNGLVSAWHGRVWLNPPYGTETGKWLARLIEHGNGIALIFARTETDDWVKVWRTADAIMFIYGRLHFYRPNGIRAKFNSGAPSALIAYGQNNVTALRESGISGALVTEWSGSSATPKNELSQAFHHDHSFAEGAVEKEPEHGHAPVIGRAIGSRKRERGAEADQAASRSPNGAEGRLQASEASVWVNGALSSGGQAQHE